MKSGAIFKLTFATIINIELITKLNCLSYKIKPINHCYLNTNKQMLKKWSLKKRAKMQHFHQIIILSIKMILSLPQ